MKRLYVMPSSGKGSLRFSLFQVKIPLTEKEAKEFLSKGKQDMWGFVSELAEKRVLNGEIVYPFTLNTKFPSLVLMDDNGQKEIVPGFGGAVSIDLYNFPPENHGLKVSFSHMLILYINQEAENEDGLIYVCNIPDGIKAKDLNPSIYTIDESLSFLAPCKTVWKEEKFLAEMVEEDNFFEKMVREDAKIVNAFLYRAEKIDEGSLYPFALAWSLSEPVGERSPVIPYAKPEAECAKSIRMDKDDRIMLSFSFNPKEDIFASVYLMGLEEKIRVTSMFEWLDQDLQLFSNIIKMLKNNGFDVEMKVAVKSLDAEKNILDYTLLELHEFKKAAAGISLPLEDISISVSFDVLEPNGKDLCIMDFLQMFSKVFYPGILSSLKIYDKSMSEKLKAWYRGKYLSAVKTNLKG